MCKMLCLFSNNEVAKAAMSRRLASALEKRDCKVTLVSEVFKVRKAFPEKSDPTDLLDRKEKRVISEPLDHWEKKDFGYGHN